MDTGDYTVPFVCVAIIRVEKIELRIGTVLVREWPYSVAALAETNGLAEQIRDQLRRGVDRAVADLLEGR